MAVKVAAVLGLLVIAFLLEKRFHFIAQLEPGRVERLLEEAGPLAPVAFTLVMAATVVTPVPTFPLDVLAGRFFGPLLGTLYAVTGATLGALGSFLLVRWLGRDFLARFLGGHADVPTGC